MTYKIYKCSFLFGGQSYAGAEDSTQKQISPLSRLNLCSLYSARSMYFQSAISPLCFLHREKPKQSTPILHTISTGALYHICITTGSDFLLICGVHILSFLPKHFTSRVILLLTIFIQNMKSNFENQFQAFYV